jgi:hypothetical protein
MSVFHENMLIGSSGQGGAGAGYTISRTLRFNSPDSAYLSRTPASAGNRKTWTWAGWVKGVVTSENPHLFTCTTGATDATYFRLWFVSDSIRVSNYNNNLRQTSAVYRDPNAWYHIVLAVDTTQATAANRIKLYVNGSEVTAFSSSVNPNQNDDLGINQAAAHSIGATSAGTATLSGYLADIHFIDGQALTPSSFGEFDTNNVWQPKAYTGTYGTNGFHLDFADNSAATATTLGKDTSGNGNNWTPNNLSVTAGAGNDSLVDSPTNYGTDTGAGGEVRGNYCTWNPLTGAITLTNGNLDGNSTGGAWRGATGTAGVLSGKWYWESTIQSTDSGNYYGEFGFIKTTDITGAITFPSGMNGIVYYARNGRKISGGTSVVTSSSGATTGDVVQVAVDLDAGKIWFGVNNTWIDSGNPASGTNAAYTGLSGTYLPTIGVLDGGKCNTNWGARPFAYTAPSGFKALCDTNLPAPVVAKPSTVMDVKLYTGNGSTQTISGLNFSPDFVWIKVRNNARSNFLFDTVRGVEKYIISDTTGAEATDSTYLTTFSSTGFSVGSSADVNRDTSPIVAWCWDAGSTTVTNTQGSISSQVRANASAGFSIVTYTGTGGTGTVGHGLGVAPSMIIVKNRSNAVNWAVAHAGIDSNRCLNLNRDVDSSTVGFLGLDKSSFTSTTFTVNYSDTSTTVVNGSSNNYVAYCFAPVAGYSAFGSYTGNGSSDGPFVYTGFRPKWVMIKGISGGDHWYLYDSVRLGYNPRNEQLTPNLSDAEYDALSYPNIDICANGFKLRTTIGGRNSSGVLYAYAAFGESPFAYARAR